MTEIATLLPCQRAQRSGAHLKVRPFNDLQLCSGRIRAPLTGFHWRRLAIETERRAPLLLPLALCLEWQEARGKEARGKNSLERFEWAPLERSLATRAHSAGRPCIPGGH